MQTAQVILPLAIPQTYSYAVPQEFNSQIQVGCRVLVPFGKTKFYTGIVASIGIKSVLEKNLKEIAEVLDLEPLLNATQLKLWNWIQSYYLCNPGDNMVAALPSGLKLASESVLIAHPHFDGDMTDLDHDAYLITEGLATKNKLTIPDIQQILGKKNVHKTIKILLDKEVALLEEEVKEGYKPRMESYIKLSPPMEDPHERERIFGLLEKREKQMQTLLHFFDIKNRKGQVTKKELRAKMEGSDSPLKTLIKQGYLQEVKVKSSRLRDEMTAVDAEVNLTDAQNKAFEEINAIHKQNKIALLHGVTGSGKTEIYFKLILQEIAKGNQVLYLLPEIALTAQMITRLKHVFGEKAGIYHSKFSSNERIEIWDKIKTGAYSIVLGVRSSVFLPFKNLGLVIIDEEHDPSFKQNDPAPRYNGRDVGIMLANFHSATVLLGSATPSTESYYNAVSGKFGLVELNERYGKAILPEIKFIKTKKRVKAGDADSLFTPELADAVEEELAQKKQIIIFKNRRGYAPRLECDTCGFVPLCENCDVTLTYHKYKNEINCHYCGFHKPSITTCTDCGAHTMFVKGVGTERIEEETEILFRKAKIGRLDYDISKTKYGTGNLLNDFQEGKIDILTGTQMVAKGLDFGNVTLVGVLEAEHLFFHPDFRAMERGFHLLTQVSGRAGRAEDKGRVLIQTSNPERRIFQFVKNNDFKGFYSDEIEERRKFFYPPFVKLIQLSIRHKTQEGVLQVSEILYKELHKDLEFRVMQPIVPSIGRVRNWFIMQIMIKFERSKDMRETVSHSVLKAKQKLESSRGLGRFRINVDVDPY